MAFNARLCDGCPIQGRYRPLEAIGPAEAPILIVTDRPSAAAAQQGRLLTPLQMQTLSGSMQRIGFDRDHFRFTPLCHCAFDHNDFVAGERRAIIKHCRQHLLHEIETGNSDVVVTLGADATSAAVGRSVKITKMRGLGHRTEEYAQPIFPLLSPAIVSQYPQHAPLFEADVDSFRRFYDAGYDEDRAAAMEDDSVQYTIVDDLQFLIDANPDIVSFDTETTGLRWYQRGVDVRTYKEELHRGSGAFRPKFQILTMQFCIEPGKAYMLVWDHPAAPCPPERRARIRNQIRRLLCRQGRIVIGANLKYDALALWMTEDIRIRIGGDATMLATLIDENMLEKNLDVLTKLYVPAMAGYADKFNREIDKSRMWEVPLRKLLPYGAGDTDATFRVYLATEAIVAEDEKLWNYYCRVSIPGLNGLCTLESRGMLTDSEHALPQFQEALRLELEEARAEILGGISRRLKQDVLRDFVSKPANKRIKDPASKALSLTRTEFLLQLLFEHPEGYRLTPRVFTKSTAKLNDESNRKPSVSAKDHLPYFFDEYPEIERLAAFLKDQSLYEKNIISFAAKYIVNGFVRPVYSLTTAVTGRTASRDPNGQNVPKRGPRAKAYRKMYVAPPGFFVCENDLSQAELRIAASMAREPTMIRIYREGGDIHRATAAIVMGVTPEEFDALPKAEQKAARQKAKAVNFGFLYGMGWRKFIVYAKTQYNVEFTEDEAKRVRVGFFRKYNRLQAWHEGMREFADQNGYVRSFLGRKRNLPMVYSPEESTRNEAMRQAINSPIQECASSLGVVALARMCEELDPQYIQIVGFIHDAIVYYAKAEYLDWAMKTVKRYMEGTPLHDWFGVDLPVPIVSDVGFGLNLGEIVEAAEFSPFTLDQPYDFTKVVDKEGAPLFDIPEQLTPPNNGRIATPYTLDSDLEPEEIQPRDIVKASRILRGVVSPEAKARMERSRRQTIINRRLIADRRKRQSDSRANQ